MLEPTAGTRQPRRHSAGASAPNRPADKPAGTHSGTDDEEALLQWQPSSLQPNLIPKSQPLRRARLKPKAGTAAKRKAVMASASKPRDKIAAVSADKAVPAETQQIAQPGPILCLEQHASEHSARAGQKPATALPESDSIFPLSASSTGMPQRQQTAELKASAGHSSSTSLTSHSDSVVARVHAAPVRAAAVRAEHNSPSMDVSPGLVESTQLVGSATAPSLADSWDSSDYGSYADYAGSITSDSTTAAAASIAGGTSPILPWPPARSDALTTATPASPGYVGPQPPLAWPGSHSAAVTSVSSEGLPQMPGDAAWSGACFPAEATATSGVGVQPAWPGATPASGTPLANPLYLLPTAQCCLPVPCTTHPSCTPLASTLLANP